MVSPPPFYSASAFRKLHPRRPPPPQPRRRAPRHSPSPHPAGPGRATVAVVAAPGPLTAPPAPTRVPPTRPAVPACRPQRDPYGGARPCAPPRGGYSPGIYWQGKWIFLTNNIYITQEI